MEKKLILLPYEVKDDEVLLKIVQGSNQGFLVSELLVNGLKAGNLKLDKYHKVWTVESESEPNEKLGTVILQKISYEHGSSQLIITFKEREIYQNHKLFATLLEKLTKYAFDELGLQRLYVEVLENNLKLKEAYEKFGFVEEGLLRSRYEVKKRRYDAYIMSMLKIEWERREEK